jgi:hypothetical protein
MNGKERRLQRSENTSRSNKADKTRYKNWDEFKKSNPEKQVGETIKNQMNFLLFQGLEFTIDSLTNFEIFWNESHLTETLEEKFIFDSFKNHFGNWNLTLRKDGKTRFSIKHNKNENIHSIESLEKELNDLDK